VPVDDVIATEFDVSNKPRFVVKEALEKSIVSPLRTPPPVTGLEIVTVVLPTAVTVVPVGITPEVVASCTSIPTTTPLGTDENVSVEPEAVAALVVPLTVVPAEAPGGTAQDPPALKNIPAA
jgi:hypothetical protein